MPLIENIYDTPTPYRRVSGQQQRKSWYDNLTKLASCVPLCVLPCSHSHTFTVFLPVHSVLQPTQRSQTASMMSQSPCWVRCLSTLWVSQFVSNCSHFYSVFQACHFYRCVVSNCNLVSSSENWNHVGMRRGSAVAQLSWCGPLQKAELEIASRRPQRSESPSNTWLSVRSSSRCREEDSQGLRTTPTVTTGQKMLSRGCFF